MVTAVATAIVSPLRVDGIVPGCNGSSVDYSMNTLSDKTSSSRMAPLDNIVSDNDSAIMGVENPPCRSSSGQSRDSNSSSSSNNESASYTPLNPPSSLLDEGTTSSSAVASSTNDLSTDEQGTDRSQDSQDSSSRSSSLLDVLLGQVSDGITEEQCETDTSVILSDAGESKCASNVPVINLAFAKAAGTATNTTVADGGRESPIKEDTIEANHGEPSFYTAKDGSATTSGSILDEHHHSPVVKTTISSGPQSPLAELDMLSTSAHSKALSLRRGRLSPVKLPGMTSDSSGDRSSHDSRSKSPRKANSLIPLSPSSAYNNSNTGSNGGFDKKRLSERLRQRLAKRNAAHHEASRMASISTANGNSPNNSPKTKGGRYSPDKEETISPNTKSSMSDRSRDRSHWETRLQAASRQKRRSKSNSRAKSEGTILGDNGANSDILSKYSQSSEVDNGVIGGNGDIYPDLVTFSDGEEDEGRSPGNGLRVSTKVASRDRRTAYRKCVSEVGASLSLSTRAARSKLSKHHHSHHHGIGILQADGIVYDDALLLRLARQARYGRLRGEVAAHAITEENLAGRERVNDVKIHVYDLLTKDALVEMPYFNCNFPIGQCFKVVNDGCHVLGTGAYHVGVEVNGVEYAFGANNIIGMSGIFTCVPKESPGYEFRESLDFGKIHTTKRTWIRIPKTGTGASFDNLSAALGESAEHDDPRRNAVPSMSSPLNARSGAPSPNDNHNRKDMGDLFSFREIESFADGHAIVYSMAREYMGTDYDLLRKNCCTFARDVCIRMGVAEDKIPSWFHNAAKAGADAEDAITSVEYSMRNMLDCAEGVDPLDLECYNHGFEVIIPNLEQKGAGIKLTAGLKVVESPTMRTPRERRPLGDSEDLSLSDMHETASWTY